MKNFFITFGSGVDEIKMICSGNDIYECLSELYRNGWETENITEIIINDLTDNTQTTGS